MITKDYENAEKQAKRLVSIQPSVFKNYMIYFSITMAHKNYVSADRNYQAYRDQPVEVDARSFQVNRNSRL